MLEWLSQGSRGRAILLLALGLAGGLSAVALGGGAASHDTVSLPTLTGPAGPRPPGPTITSTISSSTSSPIVGSPFTLTAHWQDVNISTAFTGTVSGLASTLTVQTAQNDNGPCSETASAVQCPLGGLAPGSLVAATVVLVATTPGTYTLASNGFGDNSTSSVVVTAVPAPPAATAAPTPTADLSVRTPRTTLSPKVGRVIRAGVDVRNDGPVGDNGTTLALKIPPQLRLVAATAQSGTCDLKKLRCRLGSLSAQGSDLVVVTFRAVRAGKGHVVVRVAEDLTDPSLMNNVGSLSVDIPKPSAKH